MTLAQLLGCPFARFRCVSTAVCLSVLGSQASAAVLFEDNFNYPINNGVTSLIGASGGNWLAMPGSSGNDLLLDNGAALVRSANAQDVKSKSFTTINTSATAAHYAAFDLTIESAPAGTGTWLGGFNENEVGGNGSYVARIFVKPASGNATKFQIGVATIDNSTPVYIDDHYAFNSSIRVILGYRSEVVAGPFSARLWVNAVQESAPFVALSNSAVEYVDRFALRQPGTGASNHFGTARIDNLKIATEFNDLVAPVPEPTGVALAAVATAGFLMRRRDGRC